MYVSQVYRFTSVAGYILTRGPFRIQQDPLNLADKDFWGFGNEATIGFLRHSEIKHGRIAMFAFVGYIVQSNFVFPWPQTLAGAAHPAASLGPEAQWDAVPVGAKWQIFAVISALELWDECGGGAMPHYMKGRQPGKYPSFQPFRDSVHPVLDLYDPFGFNKNMSPETKERRLICELNIVPFLIAHTLVFESTTFAVHVVGIQSWVEVTN